MISRTLRTAFFLFSALLSLTMSVAHANTPSSAQILQIDLSRDTPEADVYLNLKVDLQLSEELRNALNRGLSLFFTLDLKVYEPRQFWFDRLVLERSHTWRLQYNALLRQWRVKTDAHIIEEFSLEDSLVHITELQNWLVPQLRDLDPLLQYEGELRLKLDTSLLPRPFQITAINNSSAWSLTSAWKKFTILLSDIKPSS